MPLAVPCPNCGAILKAPEGMAGRKARCKKCRHRFRLPGQKVSLSDEELSRLAALADKVQNDVVAGESAHRQILKYAIIGAATSILIWVIVTHRAT